jgi:hypothetical protein
MSHLRVEHFFYEFFFHIFSVENVSDVTTETAAAYYAAINSLVTSKERNLLYPVKVVYTGEEASHAYVTKRYSSRFYCYNVHMICCLFKLTYHEYLKASM